MEEKYNNIHVDEIDFQELFKVLFNGKSIIISVTSLISIIGVLISLFLPNIYESKALLVPVNSSSSISGTLRNYSGLAGLAGISLPSDANQSNSVQAISKINSLSFFEDNIFPQIFLPNLMAVKSWNSERNLIEYDDNIYIGSSKTWIVSNSQSNKKQPSVQDGFEVFKKEHLMLNEDKKTGFVTLSIKHQSPYIAKQWVELIVKEINTFYRDKDKLESEKAVSYLNKQIALTNLSEIKVVISELLQEETQKLALIEANQSYVFDYIDPPSVMEKKIEPNRALICLLGLLVGLVNSFLIVFAKHYHKEKKT